MDELYDWHQLHPDTTFVFQGKNDIPPTSNAANKQLRRDLDDIGATKIITFHGLRHTHASWLLAHDVDLHYVSERLGHSNTTSSATKVLHRKTTGRRNVVKSTFPRPINLYKNAAGGTRTHNRSGRNRVHYPVVLQLHIK